MKLPATARPLVLALALTLVTAGRAADAAPAHPGPSVELTDSHGRILMRAPTGHLTNYDEDRVPPYPLPDPLVLLDGRPVRDAATWLRERRPELLELYTREVFGRVPATAPRARFEVLAIDPAALAGRAVRKLIAVHLGDGPDAPVVHLQLFLPAQATRPVPVLLHLVFFNNPPLPGEPPPPPPTPGQPPRPPVFPVPVPDLLAHGYGYATFRYTEIQPDTPAGVQSGVIGLARGAATGPPAPDAWGAIGAWAWGTSRVLDYLTTDASVDASRVALIGHSRLGKTVLWAGAQDPRFALVFSSCAGEMGSALSRRDFGETIDDMIARYSYHFAGNFQRYSGHWNQLPVDAHLLIALLAPRPVFITAGSNDLWSDPQGEYLAEVAAGPVYRLLGRKDLGATEPRLDTPLTEGALGFLEHTGEHTVTAADWKAFLDFADRHLRATP